MSVPSSLSDRPADDCSGSCRASRNLRAACRLSLTTHQTPHPFFQQPNPMAVLHADIERLIAAAGVEPTIIRPGCSRRTRLSWRATAIRADGVVRWPYGGAQRHPSMTATWRKLQHTRSLRPQPTTPTLSICADKGAPFAALTGLLASAQLQRAGERSMCGCFFSGVCVAGHNSSSSASSASSASWAAGSCQSGAIARGGRLRFLSRPLLSTR